MYTIKRVVKLKVKGFEDYDDLSREDVIFETEDLGELLKAVIKIDGNLKLAGMSKLISGESKYAFIESDYIHHNFYTGTRDRIIVDFIAEVTE